MKNFNAFSKFVLMAALMLVFTNCKDDHFSRYEDPPWLSGSIIETLQDTGNCTIFLELMEKAGYEEPITKGLFTVFVANDSAYQAYFNSKGIASVDDLTEQEAFKLFTLNVINTPRSRTHLIYDYLEYHGGWQEPNSEVGALLWRVATRSESPDYVDHVRYYKDFLDEDLKVIGQEKLVPLLSTEFLVEYGADPSGSDYNYFFPETEWSGLQWYNANIVEAEVKTSNGFIYYLDRVVPEIPSIDEYLKDNQDQFGVFYDLMQRFAVYSFSDYDDDVDKTSLYIKNYHTVSDVSAEIIPGTNPPYDRKNSYTAFIPTDDVLEPYINEKFLQNFESLDSVPEISLAFLVQACILEAFQVPSKMPGNYTNAYGDNVDIDLNTDVKEATLLSNGPFFAMNVYNAPRAFESTISPLFFNRFNSTYLYIINQAKMIASLTATDLDVTLFAPTNEGLLDGKIRYYEPRETLERLADNGEWLALTFEQAKELVGDHVSNINTVDFSGEGFLRMNSGNYIYYHNNKVEAGGNQEIGNVATIVKTEEGDNGVLYSLDKAIIGPRNNHAMYIGNDEDLSEFYNLLYIAGLADTIIDSETEVEYPNLGFMLSEDEWTVFAPTNDAIIDAQNNGLIPTEQAELQKFLRYHFVAKQAIFDDGEFNGQVYTTSIDSVTIDRVFYAPIEVNNAWANLSLVDRAGNTVNVEHQTANSLVQYGVLHKINKVLQNQ